MQGQEGGLVWDSSDSIIGIPIASVSLEYFAIISNGSSGSIAKVQPSHCQS